MEFLPKAKDFMSTTIITLKPDMDIFDAISLLLKNEISGAPVIDDSRQVVGILSEKDTMKILANEAFYDLPGGNVSQFMSTDVTTISPDANLYTIADMFFTMTFRRLPVVQEGKLLGQVSRRDVMKEIKKGMQLNKKNLKSEMLSHEMEVSLQKRSKVR